MRLGTDGVARQGRVVLEAICSDDRGAIEAPSVTVRNSPHARLSREASAPFRAAVTPAAAPAATAGHAWDACGIFVGLCPRKAHSYFCLSDLQAMTKGNMEGARIHAENAIREKSQAYGPRVAPVPTHDRLRFPFPCHQLLCLP